MSEDYIGKTIIVRWDIMKCAHAGKCVKALPAVFDAGKTPWVDPDGAGVDDIAKAVGLCPAKALSYETKR